MYTPKDRYFKKAKETGFRSRAAFKLIEMDKQFRLMKPGMLVVDLGCAPGSWMQVASSAVGPTGRVIGIDLEEIQPFSEKNATFIKGDIREPYTNQRLLSELSCKVDLVISDMAPHLSGIKFKDQYQSYELADMAFKICPIILKKGGNLVIKVFPGEENDGLKKEIQTCFTQVKVFIPDATRKTSSEVYFIAKGYK